MKTEVKGKRKRSGRNLWKGKEEQRAVEDTMGKM